MGAADYGRLVLGGLVTATIVSYYTLLETTCSSTDPNEGAGELVITLGGGAKGTETGTRFLAPLRVNAGAALTSNGTADAPLLWIEDLCDEVLDCSTCPTVLRPDFDTSILLG